MTEPTALYRPASACVLHRAPSDGRSWTIADNGYRTCSSCLDRLRDDLSDIATRYAKLDARPGASGDHGSRGAPGFESRSPASDHVIAMRDHRSSQDARVWVAADGRVHRESETPPLSVFGALETEAFNVAELREMDEPTPRATVADLCRWLDGQLDWITRGELVVEFSDTIRSLLSQLKPMTGDKRRRIGMCPNVLDEGDTTRECGAPLYAPTDNARDDTIWCHMCGRKWPRTDWLRLGDLLNAS